MVGKLGCGCCEAPELCPGVDYLKTFSDDFSPDFESDWNFVSTFFGLTEFIARDGVCSLRGNNFPNSNFSQARGWINAEKKTIGGAIEISLKLTDFPVNVLSTGWGELARAAIGIWSPAESTREIWFEAINIDSTFEIFPGVLHPYAGLRGFNFRDVVAFGSTLGIQYFIPQTPQLGDVIKIRFSDCVQDPFFASDTRVQTIKAYVNDIEIFNYEPSGDFRIRTCDFDAGMHLNQFRFGVVRSATNPGTPYHPQMMIIKVDDFTFESL